MKNWQEVKDYLEELGLDPHKLACGCAVKIDLEDIVYPALRNIKSKLERIGIRILDREDADICPRYGKPKIMRGIYSLDELDFSDLKEFEPQRAISLTSIHRPQSPEELENRWLRFYQKLASEGVNITVGKGHTIEAYSKEDEFILFDFFKSDRGFKSAKGRKPKGYLIGNNDTIQIIDPTKRLGAKEQVFVALSNALNDLFVLGAVDRIRIFPTFAAPSEEVSNHIEENMKVYSHKYGFELVNEEPLPYKAPLLGATVFGETRKEPPVFYDRLRKGDLILAHRPFGDLAPINLYIGGLMMGNEYLEERGVTLQEVERAKEERIETMACPNLKVGKIINRYSPTCGESFLESEHIKVTGDISGPGIGVLPELAEKGGVDIKLWDLPLKYKKMVKVASNDHLLPNGTTGTNGAIIIIGSRQVIEKVGEELDSLEYNPQVIGEVKGAGSGILTVPRMVMSVVSKWPEEKTYKIKEKITEDRVN